MTEKPTQHPDQAESANAQPEQKPAVPAETPVSDEAVKPDGSGEHGRPSDDSDPGHS